MKASSLFGLVAIGATLGYFLTRKSEGTDQIDGLEIKVNPEKLIDGALAVSSINPMAKEGIRTIAHKALDRYYGKD